MQNLSWWRRNWVDLLMVALILVVVAGFLTLLLRGNVSGLFGRQAAADTGPAPTPAASTDRAPAASPHSTPNTGTPAASSAATPPAPGTATPTAANSAPSATAIAPANQTKPAGVKLTPVLPVVPTQPSGAPSAAPTTTAPISSGPAAKPRTPSHEEYFSNYRVGIMASNSPAKAEQVAAGLRAAGEGQALAVPTSNGLTTVVIGPFKEQAVAVATLARVRGRFPDALLYSPRPAATGPAVTPPATTSAASPSKPADASGPLTPPTVGIPAKTPPAKTTPTPSPTPATTSGAAANQNALLQVGAFKVQSSADPAVKELQGAGYLVTLSVDAKGFTRVLVGPVSAAEQARVRQDLERRGYQPFIVK